MPVDRAPIFVMGHWRTGTTFMHDFFAEDPNLAYPTTYECFFPHHFLLTEEHAAEGDEGAAAQEAAAGRRAGRLRPAAGGRVRHDDARRGHALSHPCLAALRSRRQRLSRLRGAHRSAEEEEMGRRLSLVLPAARAQAWRQAAGDEVAGQCRAAQAPHRALPACPLHLYRPQSAARVSVHREALARALFDARLAQPALSRCMARRLRARHVRAPDRGATRRTGIWSPRTGWSSFATKTW